jgi:signal transduction histidine kinase
MIRVQRIFSALAALAWAANGFGQQASEGRVFKVADGLPDADCRYVTFSGAGNVIVSGLNSSAVAVGDGYGWTNYAVPQAQSAGRIFQSPAGQLWRAASNGLCDWSEGGWRFYPVTEIAAQRRAAPRASMQLCPVRQNVTLFLLPERLMEFTANPTGAPTTRVLGDVKQTSLGRFDGWSVAPDDSIWIAGENGLAHIPGPKRAIDEHSVWRESDLPATAGQNHLRAPVCDDAGGVTCLGDAGRILHFDGERWTIWKTGRTNLIAAWTESDEVIWAATTDALLRMRGGIVTTNDELAASSIYDVAIGEHGMFWLATSEGLFCHAPMLWRAASEAPASFVSAMQPETHYRALAATPGAPKNAFAFLDGPDGKTWCATPENVWSFDGRNWATARGSFGRINTMMRGSDGSVWVAAHDGLHHFARGAWVDYGLEEGLSSAVVRDVREDATGQIWAMTARGWNVRQPAADLDPPRAVVRVPAERDRNILQGESIMVSFSGQDKWNLTPPARLLFSWRMDDRDWSPFDAATTAPFIDLPPGKHYFQVRAMDRNGNIDPQPPRLEFAVILPWYKEVRLIWIAGFGAAAALFFAGLAWKRHRDLALSYIQVELQVAQRTEELKLANQELLQSQKMKALGALAAGIAHDFNNILSIIKGSTQIIEQNIDNPQKIRARAERIKTVVDQGTAVVQALLGFSRNTDELTETCEVNAAVENTIRLLGDRFLRETEVRFDRGGPLPAVRASAGLLQQILLNFIFNAAESMSARKEVIVTTAPCAEMPPGVALSPAGAASYVCIAVRDFGCGIAPEIMPRIFEPFFTSKALSTRRGTGLGLSVAYELAQKLKAGLAVESTPGQGSVFTLILPAALTPAPAAQPDLP